jgi:hypothetical protein
MTHPVVTPSISRRVVLTTAALALAGCSGDPASPEPLEPCTGAVVVSVGSGLTPTISWTPACSMIGMIVEEGADDFWIIAANTDEGFGPGVKYGTPPTGTTPNGPALPLTAGVLYDITLVRGTMASPAISTNHEFTP